MNLTTSACTPKSIIVDRFSKMAHFVSLTKLPSAKETTKLVLVHIFRLHSLRSWPSDHLCILEGLLHTQLDYTCSIAPTGSSLHFTTLVKGFSPLMSRRRGNLFVLAATEYYKNRNILQEQVLTIAKISNKIKKGRNRNIYIFT